ncbi:alpha/beta hydrolase [Streptomyces sp. NPDC002589]|uniref:alpha/beta fold hydrolase n=1 Tax=Streptomyces sp. NPDC002589 TaxID=3154420 RepID=UPI00331EA6C5
MASSTRSPGGGAPRPPVVFVHGTPETATVWGPVLEELDRDDVFVLSPPGFGAPLHSGFEATVSGYRGWLESQLEAFKRPVDLVGHDWGGEHVVQVAMHRPALIRSWTSDMLQLFAPDYVWHPLAQVWQEEGPGETSVAELFGGAFEQKLAVVHGMGIAGIAAERFVTGFDESLGRAVLSLLRSAVQPVMTEAGSGLAKARQRPGLALIAAADPNGNVEMHRWAAQQAGADIAVLEGIGHWWPATDPRPAVEAMTRFWAGLS